MKPKAFHRCPNCGVDIRIIGGKATRLVATGGHRTRKRIEITSLLTEMFKQNNTWESQDIYDELERLDLTMSQPTIARILKEDVGAHPERVHVTGTGSTGTPGRPGVAYWQWTTRQKQN